MVMMFEVENGKIIRGFDIHNMFDRTRIVALITPLCNLKGKCSYTKKLGLRNKT